jgi:hypothetical protein
MRVTMNLMTGLNFDTLVYLDARLKLEKIVRRGRFGDEENCRSEDLKARENLQSRELTARESELRETGGQN